MNIGDQVKKDGRSGTVRELGWTQNGGERYPNATVEWKNGDWSTTGLDSLPTVTGPLGQFTVKVWVWQEMNNLYDQKNFTSVTSAAKWLRAKAQMKGFRGAETTNGYGRRVYALAGIE